MTEFGTITQGEKYISKGLAMPHP